MQKSKIFFFALLISLLIFGSGISLACTSVGITPGASADGSAITSHTDDSGTDTFHVLIVPAKDWEEGEMRQIIWSRKHDEYRQLRDVPFVKGEIPQAAHTYAHIDSSYSFQNEMGLSFGEHTIGGRRELRNTSGWFEIGELMRLSLERCTTAREAIQLMGDLAVRYGFGGSAEALMIIDSLGEVWFWEVYGPGPLWMGPDSGDPGAVWVAQRVPDGEISVGANRSRIGAIDLNDPDYFMASDNIFSLAQEMGWWDPDSGEEFKVYETYGYRSYSPGNARREWRVFDLLAPSLNLDPWAERYPFSIKPDKPVTVEDIMMINRDHYEGTEFDATVGLAAGPFGGCLRYRNTSADLPEGSFGWQRTICHPHCNYSTIVVVRPDMPPAIGAMTWFAYARPCSSCYIPIYAGAYELPESFRTGRRGADYDPLTKESAWWAFNIVADQTDRLYNLMIEDVKAVRDPLEKEFLTVQPFVEKTALELYEQDEELARQFLTTYTNSAAIRVTDAYWSLASRLMARYSHYRMYDNYPNYNIQIINYPDWWLKAVDFGKDNIPPEN